MSSNFNPFNLVYNGIKYILNNNYNDNHNYIIKPEHLFVNNLNLIIFNIDGVLWNNQHNNKITNNEINKKNILIAKETFNSLIKTDIPICIITNECRHSPKIIKKMLKEQGFIINYKNEIKIITSGLLMINHISSIINPDNCDIINNKVKTHIKYESERKLNFAIIGEQDIYYYINQNILNKYSNVKFHWINDKICPSVIDYFIITILNNEGSFNIIEKRLMTWIKQNPTAKFIITSNEVVKGNDVNEAIYPLTILDKLKMSFTLEEHKINQEYMKNIKLNIECPSTPHNNILKKILENNFGLNIIECNNKLIESSKNNILMIDDNNSYNLKKYNDLNIYKSLVLSGRTKIQDLSYAKDNNTILQDIDFIIPDISYLIT
jgi:hypothetical protein